MCLERQLKAYEKFALGKNNNPILSEKGYKNKNTVIVDRIFVLKIHIYQST